jgi:large subunit ribosomal protein L13
MKTISAKADDVKRDWFLVDADGKTLGRLATEIARRLRGKHKTIYTPHVDTGDYIVVINAEKIRVTGNKAQNKIYYNHSGYMGGLKQISFEKLIDKAPERVIERAVKGMLRQRTWACSSTAATVRNLIKVSSWQNSITQPVVAKHQVHVFISAWVKAISSLTVNLLMNFLVVKLHK